MYVREVSPQMTEYMTSIKSQPAAKYRKLSLE